MPVSRHAKENLERASWIRRMYEEGLRLRAEVGAERVLDFSLGNPDVDPPAAFGAVLRELAAASEPGSHGYMPNAGYPEVRAAVALKASREQGVELGAGNVVMTVGAAGGLNVALKSIVDPGDEVVIIKPYFGEYASYASNHGGVVVEAAAGSGFRLDAAEVARVLSPRTACVIVNSPNNPSGVIYSKEEIEALARALRAHGEAAGRFPYLIADEPYREIVYRGAVIPSVMASYDETIVVSSWSKSLSLPGERIGYAAISPRCAEARLLFEAMSMATRILGFVNAPALMQRAVSRLLDERCDVESYARRGELLAEGLRAAGYEFPEPQGAFYIFARVPTRPGEASGDDVAFVMGLKRYGILGVPGLGFGCPGWFRLSYCVPERRIVAALPLFARAIKEWRADR